MTRANGLAVRTPDGRTCPIPDQGRLVVGAAPGDGGLRVEGAGVASEHVALATVKGGGHGVMALDEEATTTLDGRPVKKARVGAGARLVLGSVTLELLPLDADGRIVAAPRAPSTRRGPNPPAIAGFRVGRLLGKGTMGLVWLAVQESLDREVALKVLRKQLADNAQFVARFQAEARAAAKLAHPNVVTVYDVGESGGHHYLALEYMQRGSLEDRLGSEGPLPWRAVLGILRDAAAGLEFAEQHGIVHRDIKPANLMQSASGQTKIVDLGLATAHADPDGKIRGTPHFMAPEQARGLAVDARTDLYALGATAYRLLSGKTPFEGETTKAILRSVVLDEPPPLAALVDGLPEEVAGLVHALIAKDPADRPQSAKVLRARIADLVARLGGAEGGADSGADGAGSDSGGGKGLLVAGLVAIVAAAVGAVAIFGGGGDGPERPPAGPDPIAASPIGADSIAAAGDAPVDDDPPVDDTPSEPDDPQPDSPADESAEDAALRLLEERASAALLATEALADPLERASALRELAALYPGTTAATTALARADELAAAAAADEQAPVDTAPAGPSAAEVLLEQARALTRDEGGELLPPELAFAGLESFVLPPGYLPGEEYTQGFEALRAELYADLRALADARLEAPDAALVAGRFDEAREGYVALRDWLTARPTGPESDDDSGAGAEAGGGAGDVGADADGAAEDPSGAAADGSGVPRTADELAEMLATAPPDPAWRLAGRVALVRERLALLPTWIEVHALAMRQADRALVARRIPRGPLETGLRRFELAAAAAVARGLVADLRSPAYRAPLGVLADELAAAPTAFAALAEADRAGEWRRRSIVVPGGNRLIAEVRSARGDGLTLDEVGGAPARLQWSDFASDSDALDQLFESRLGRDWTATELAAIATLVRVAAVNEVLAMVEPVFDSGTRARLSPLESRRVDDALGRALEWAERAGRTAPAETEQRAADLLRIALRAIDESDWTSATWALERLVDEEPTALLVLVLSDGRPLEEPAVWPPDLPAPPPPLEETR